MRETPMKSLQHRALAEGKVELSHHLLCHFFRFFPSPASSQLLCLEDNAVNREEEGTDIARTPQKASPASGEGKVAWQFPFLSLLGMNERKLLECRAAKGSLRER